MNTICILLFPLILGYNETERFGDKMSQNPLILICDDDPVVHESLGIYMYAEGYLALIHI